MVRKIRINNTKLNESFERDRLYDELCLTLTDYEEGIDDANDLYNMLVKIQNNWETVITAED